MDMGLCPGRMKFALEIGNLIRHTVEGHGRVPRMCDIFGLMTSKTECQGAEKFRANIDDDPERAEFWLKNSVRVFDELSCTPEESLKCVVSLLRDLAYRWWKTLTSVVLRKRVTWDFFLEEF
ncbi:Protein MCM10 [Gossypium australe]|uniref:Protein MCM10 n=1 Tax=Gossypium australe TaxID=47621 RepID=A0A5B6WRX4_9ROSI|nr:Protein MCM10 [Gossypium australe]